MILHDQQYAPDAFHDHMNLLYYDTIGHICVLKFFFNIDGSKFQL